MISRCIALALAAGLMSLSPVIEARTLTGADILSMATFPTESPTLAGSALIFGPVSTYAYQKVMSLPVSDYLEGNALDLSFDMTRLACAHTCDGDSNPIFGISDGTHVIVMSPGEDFNGALGTGAGIDAGDHFAGFFYAITLAENVGYPDVGGSYNFNLHFEFRPDGVFAVGMMNSSTVSYMHSYVLDTSNLQLVLFHDNDLGEQYQINAIGVADTELPVAVDIKPGSCPNPVGLKELGVLPVAINGTAAFAATDIDPESVRLAGVAPIRYSYEDAATPYEPYAGKAGRNACTTARGDGIVDLALKFSTQQILQAVGPVSVGDEVTVRLSGTLHDGSQIVGEDVVWIRP